jgi:arsenite/tail-anchored protein-transporting ATPase
VGKTTCAAGLAVAAARRGRTLLISTDPASSLGDVLGDDVTSAPGAVSGVRGLDAVNLDAPAAFAAWLEPRRPLLSSIALRGTYLDEGDVERLLRLSLPGIDEVVGLLAVTRIGSRGYDDVFVDTAPTGHTLRLLSAPALLERVAQLLDTLQAHHREVVSALRGRYETDPADDLIAEIERDGAALAATLRDRAATRLLWVTLPEPMALEETTDAIASLERDGLHVGTIVLNRVTGEPPQPCGWCDARRRFEARSAAPLHRRFPDAEIAAIPEIVPEPRGVAAVRKAAAALTRWNIRESAGPPVRRRTFAAIADAAPVHPAAILAQTPRWVLFGGKGGVGKSTCAAAFALDLARASPSARVLLLSSDPAHSLGDVFGVKVHDRPQSIAAGPPNLHVREIDAAAALQQFRQRYLDSVDALFDRIARDMTGDRIALRQIVDLVPPGVDEVIAIADVAEAVAEPDGRYDTIVSDTAPTGHALRLLQTPAVLREWTQTLMSLLLKYRDLVPSGALAAMLVQLSKRLRSLSALLTDPRQTRFVLVTRAAALPRAESLRLRKSLTDLGIDSTTLVVNALGGGTCTRCRTRARAGRDEIQRLRSALRDEAPYAIIGAPAVMPPPHGVRALAEWGRTWRRLD